MADLSLVGKSSTNFQKSVNSLKLKEIEGGKLELFCHEADNNNSASMIIKESKTDKVGITRKLFDAIFSHRKAEGTTCNFDE